MIEPESIMSRHHSLSVALAAALLSSFLCSSHVAAAANAKVIYFKKTLCNSDAEGALCNATSPPLPASFLVPRVVNKKRVQQLVIEFVSGSCVGAGRASAVFLSAKPAVESLTDDTGDNFIRNTFYLPYSQFISPEGENGTQGFSQPAKIYWSPGDSVTLERDSVQGGAMRCTIALNGYYEVR